jgi:putative ABC transport system permease protein
MCSIYDSTLAYTVSAVAKNFDYTALPHETQVIAGMERYPQIESSRAGALLPRIL